MYFVLYFQEESETAEHTAQYVLPFNAHKYIDIEFEIHRMWSLNILFFKK